ncbi:hypothetical protein D3C73_1023230 [compost metagenome]
MQPLDISTSFSSVRDKAFPDFTRLASTLTSLMSLTITATLRPSRLCKMWFSKVVLPEPKYPLSTVTGILFISSLLFLFESSHSAGLAGLPVQCNALQARAILLHLQTLRMISLVLGGGIVAVAGFCTGQSYDYSHRFQLLLFNRNYYDLHIIQVIPAGCQLYSAKKIHFPLRKLS